MAFKRNENNKKTKAPARGRLPVKRTINLATVGEKPVNPFIAVPAIVLIVVAAALFSKIAVIDRMVKVSQAQAEVSYLQSQIDAGYERIESFGELVEEYAHYTYSGMTEEELQRVDRDDVMEMLFGEKVVVNTETFQNDLFTVSSKDEALTALIHLGYLGFDREEESAYIPNYEVKKAYQAALNTGSWSEIAKAIGKCDELLRATIKGKSEKVAEIVELAHDTYTSILKYNDENSLSCVLTMAYFTAPAYYNLVREFPSGKGFADFVFIPRKDAGNRPAMVVELKYNQSADTAIRQIKEKRYQGALSGYGDRILLVGISYEADGKDRKKHTCVIEEIRS